MKEHLDIIRRKFESDAYAASMGIVLDDLTDDSIRMHMRLRPDMNNFYDRPHGAAIYSLADAAFSVLGNNSNNISVALDCAITYHATPRPGAQLVVEGKMLSMTRRTASYLFSVFMEDDPGPRLIATMKALSYRTGKPIDPGIE